MSAQYVDVRELTPGFERDVCANCGDERWFKYIELDRDPDYWLCTDCRRNREDPVEYPCPDCDARMHMGSNGWECHVCGREVDADKDALIERLTAEYESPGMARSMYLECPVCTDTSIMCDPDGTLICEECDRFYAGRFTDEWFAYSVWMKSPYATRIPFLDGEEVGGVGE